MRLENKVALITGGSRGQGATEARLFAQEGAAVSPIYWRIRASRWRPRLTSPVAERCSLV